MVQDENDDHQVGDNFYEVSTIPSLQFTNVFSTHAPGGGEMGPVMIHHAISVLDLIYFLPIPAFTLGSPSVSSWQANVFRALGEAPKI